jgi:hypothetical protein
MDNELSDRQQAIKLRLAGRSVEEICQLLNRTCPAWFHTWWRRYRSHGPQRTVRSDALQRATTEDLGGTRTDDRRNSAKTGFPGTSWHTLQPHWGQFHSSRTSDLAHPSFARCAHHRAGAGTQRRNGSEGAAGTLSSSQHLSQAASQPLQSAAPSRCRRSDLSQRQPAALLHFHLQRRHTTVPCA